MVDNYSKVVAMLLTLEGSAVTANDITVIRRGSTEINSVARKPHFQLAVAKLETHNDLNGANRK